jgi:Tfp pilus assembly protein PilO
MPIRIRPSKQAFMALIVVCICMLGVCAYVYYNRASRLVELQSEVMSKETEYGDSQKTVKHLALVRQEYEDDQAQLNVLESGVSTKAYVPTLLRELEEMGRNVNLLVSGVRPKPATNPPDAAGAKGSGSSGSSGKSAKDAQSSAYDKLDVDIDAVGKYADVERFLKAINSFPKIVAINNIQLSPCSNENAIVSPKLSVKINATAFIIKDSAEVRTGDSPGSAASAQRT